MQKLVLAVLLSASSLCFAMDCSKKYTNLRKKLDSLTQQVIMCSRLGHHVSGRWTNHTYGTMSGGSMWSPSDKDQVKEDCNKVFAQWRKAKQELDLLESEQKEQK